MARTQLFRFARKALKEAHAANVSKVSNEEFLEAVEARDVTRRSFLKTALLGGAVLGTNAVFNQALAFSSKGQPSNVAIVGAGIAGLTAAHALLKKGVGVELFEASSRTGGRMNTKQNFNSQGMFCELGGELVDTGHEALMALCLELGVGVEPFENRPDLQSEVFCFGGRVYTDEGVLKAFRPLAAAMLEDVQAFSREGEIVIPTYQDPMEAKQYDVMSIREYFESKSDLVEPWVFDLLESAYRGEFGLEIDEQSALNFMTMIGLEDDAFRIFGASDEAFRIQGGSSSLTEALTARVSKAAHLHMNHRLLRLEDRGTHFKLCFQVGSSVVEKKASRVVLALPFSVLRDVEGLRNLELSAVKQKCIRELGYGTNSKVMLGFQRRFWEHATDKVPASNGSVYTDLPSQQFWDTSRQQEGGAGVMTNFLGGKEGRNAGQHSATAALCDLEKIYRGSGTLFDGNAVVKNWSHDRYVKGSYSCPLPGQYTSILGSAGEPELSGRLLFAGEHCSLESMGYMNGGVDSGLLAAEALISQR